MSENEGDPFEQLQRKAVQSQPLAQAERPTIHYSELPKDDSSQIAGEWNLYRREVGRLLAEGHEGKWVLFKGEKIIGIWDTRDEAYEVALQKYLMQPVLIHQILTRENRCCAAQVFSAYAEVSFPDPTRWAVRLGRPNTVRRATWRLPRRSMSS